MTPAKSRRIDEKLTVLNGPQTSSSIYLGAKSVSGRETEVRRKREDTNWLKWVDLENGKKCSNPGGFRLKDKNE